MLGNLWSLFKRFMGWPEPATEAQKNEELVEMRQLNDCHNPVIANSTGVTYEEASRALLHYDLPSMLESPIMSNPWNLYRALIVLGFWKKNITLTMLLAGDCEPGKTIVLLHNPENPLLAQHWITWHGIENGLHLLAWGNSQEFKRVTPELLTDYYRKGFPNCAFQVYKCNILRVWWEKIKMFFSK